MRFGILCLLMALFSALSSQDTLLLAIKSAKDVKDIPSIINRIVKDCDKKIECYQPFVDFLISKPSNDIKLQGIASLSQSLYQNALLKMCQEILLAGVENANSLSVHHARLGGFYNYLTLVNKDLNQLDVALSYAEKTYNEYKLLGKSNALWQPVYNRYLIYIQLKKYDLADKYLKQAYDLVKDSESRMDKGFVLYTLLSVSKSRGRMDEFDQYLNLYLKFKKEGAQGKPLNPVHLGLLELFDDKESGIKLLEEKLKLIEKDSLPIVLDKTRLELANKYTAAGKYMDAEHQLDSVIVESPDFTYTQKMAYFDYYNLYKKSNQPQKAYASIEKYLALQDSSYKLLLDNKIADYEVKYSTQQKENEIMRQDFEIRSSRINQSRIIGWGSFIVLSAFSGLFFFYRRYKFQKALAAKEKKIQDQQISELEQKNKLLALNSMIEGQESERLRIAQDLHDGLGGLLTTVKAHFNTIEREMETIKNINIYKKTNALIDEACGEVRRIAHDMVPHSLSINGLQGVLEDIKNSTIASGLECEVDLHNIDFIKISEQKSVMIYRIIQELVNNVIKHANAKKLVIQMIGHDNGINIMIEDDGKGFDVNELINKKGLGLKGLESRVNYLSGKLNIDSSPVLGTTINIEIPLSPS